MAEVDRNGRIGNTQTSILHYYGNVRKPRELGESCGGIGKQTKTLKQSERRTRSKKDRDEAEVAVHTDSMVIDGDIVFDKEYLSDTDSEEEEEYHEKMFQLKDAIKKKLKEKLDRDRARRAQANVELTILGNQIYGLSQGIRNAKGLDKEMLKRQRGEHLKTIRLVMEKYNPEYQGQSDVLDI